MPGGFPVRGPGVTIRGSLLLVAVFSLFPSLTPAAPIPPAPAHRAAAPFGISLPATHDRAAWQQWRQQVQAKIESGRARVRANAASGGSAGIIETLAGAAPFQKPVNALQTSFGSFGDIAEDSKGNLYLASCDLGIVVKIDGNSNATVYAGQPLSVGPGLSTGDGGSATSAQLPCPSVLAIDSQDNLYISDVVAGTVREVNGQTGIIQTIAGTPGQFGHLGDGGPGHIRLVRVPKRLGARRSGQPIHRGPLLHLATQSE